MREPVDLLVIGGGVNGTSIARDATGRGLQVVLCEQDDLAGHTSSASSKLVHGGLRYLERYEFRLVREALLEREVLLQAAPHIIWPLRFVLPHSPEQRPVWMIRLGLLLYDHLGGRKKLEGSQRIDLQQHEAGRPLQEHYRTAFTYADCWVEDSRLVVLNAIDAAARGASILTRTRCVGARRLDGLWTVELEPAAGSGRRVVRARALVNAAGPWVSDLLTREVRTHRPKQVRLVKGSHIVVRRLFDHPSPYILQNDDRRIVFVMPYEDDYSLIGTTDVAYRGDPATVAISDDEVEYLCRAVGRYFRKQLTADEIVWSYAGVRPLYDDASSDVSAITRDYVFDVDRFKGQAPLLSIFGGKITTSRKLAEHALERLQPELGFDGRPWTAGAPLPGGDMPDADFERWLADFQGRHRWLPAKLARRYGRAYGTRTERFLDGARALDDLGEHFGDDLYEAEVDYLVRTEWAQADEDVLWRRSKLGLHIGEGTAAKLRAWFGRNRAG